MSLEKELETYKTKVAGVKDHEGKYVLIHGDDVVDYFTSYEDAIKAGYQQFGLTPFLVKQVRTVEQVLLISRFVDPFTRPATT